MSLIAVNNSPLDVSATRIDQTIGRPLDQRSRTGGPAPAGSGSLASAPSRPATASASSPQPPEGTDPALWSILTSEERAYFANSVTSGPLTYSKVMMPNRAASSALPAARGGRVDVRA